MSAFASTPAPPYWAVIFTSRHGADTSGYDEMAARMVALSADQPGFLGIESVRDATGVGITVSYWRAQADARAWKAQAEHREAQRIGRERWYREYRVRVARVERDYGTDSGER